MVNAMQSHHAVWTPEVDGPGESAQVVALVAQSYTGSPIGFGLDRELELRGGDRLGPNGVASTMVADWAPGFQASVAAACEERRDGGERWFHMRPTALVGRAGTGRMHLARQLARHGDLPVGVISLAGRAGSQPMRRPRPDWCIQVPAAPVQAMAASGCANPVLLVTSVEEASQEAMDVFASMLATHSAGHWIEQGLGATIDLSHVNWIVQVERPETLSTTLERTLHLVDVDRIKNARDVDDLVAIGVLDEVLADLDLNGSDLVGDPAPLIEDLRHRVLNRIPMIHIHELAQGGVLRLAELA
jgi:hypothetical protein